MTGIEQMFAKMIGLQPSELKEMAVGFVATVNSINERLGAIESKVSEMHALTMPIEERAKDAA